MSIGKRIAVRGVRAAKNVAKKVIGLLPPRAARLTGRPAKHGGLPVRDLRFRPWKRSPEENISDWLFDVGPQMRNIFLSGAEGLPQTLSKEFAEKWAEYCGVRHAILLPHGTDALRFALAAALDHDGLEYGGEVIVPNLTFIATANAVLDRRFSVALVDVDPKTLNLDPIRVEEAIIPGKTRAIMPVHLFGQPADMARLREIAARHSLALIEDAAQAHGALHDLGSAGSLGDVAAFSFQSSKNMSSGEGGVLTTNDPAIFERAHGMSNVGRALVGAQRWTHFSLGWNCRPSEYVAAVLLHRLKTIEAEQHMRFERFQHLRKSLADVACVEPLDLGPGVRRHGAYMFVMRYRPEKCGGLALEDLLNVLGAEGIPAYRCYDLTLAQQPALQTVARKHPDYVRVLPTPVSDAAIANTFFLPHSLLLGSAEEMEEVAAAFRKVQAYYQGSATDRATTAMAQQAPQLIEVCDNVIATKEKTRLRFGLIGVGAMGQQHAAVIGRLRHVELAALTDSDGDNARKQARILGCRHYESVDDLVQSGNVDVVVIATPHWEHARFTIAALKADLRVICEKPLAVTVAEADDVLRLASKHPNRLTVVHQTRFDPAYAYVKSLINDCELGPIYRCEMAESMWRTQAYYGNSLWRGTWKGEGGGVLLNQAPHLLDRYVWLCGRPAAVMARCDTSALHDIEVEDFVSAVLSHNDGKHGFVHVSTIECPVLSRTSLSCDRGRIIIEGGKVQVTRLRDSIRDRTAHDHDSMGVIDGVTQEISMPQLSFSQMLDAFYTNYMAAVEGREKTVCSTDDAAAAVELANAMILSSHFGRPISLPMGRDEYSHFIQSRIGSASEALIGTS